VHELQVHQVELEMQNEELRNVQQALAAVRDRYSELYDFAPVGYLTLQHGDVIVEANLTASTLLGVERARLLGTKLSRFLTPADQNTFSQHYQAVRASGTTQTCELTIQRPDGQSLPVRLESVAVQDQSRGTTQCRTALIDITVRKQTEAELRKANEELEQRVLERTTALRQSEARYRELVQERERQLIAADRLVSLGELAASLAHEFNNPLGIVLGFAQDLLSETDPSERSYRRLRIIEAETRRCAQLMQDLLNLASPPQAYPIPTDLVPVIRHTLELIAGRLRQSKVTTVTEFAPDLPPLQADPQQLEQVLLNLFFNAIEAMPQGGTLMIRATRYREPLSAGPGTEGTPYEEVLITITDTGIGIVAQDLPKIFHSFFTTKKQKGMGLGLSICESIMRAHGGRISVESTPGQGTTFFLHLPVEQSTHATNA
jgi:PAS domain S-box-containing protein